MKILFIKEKRSKSGIEGISTYLFNLCMSLEELKIPYLVIYNEKDEFYKKMIERKRKAKPRPAGFLGLVLTLSRRKKSVPSYGGTQVFPPD